jgi:hypothetical protein
VIIQPRRPTQAPDRAPIARSNLLSQRTNCDLCGYRTYTHRSCVEVWRRRDGDDA